MKNSEKLKLKALSDIASIDITLEFDKILQNILKITCETMKAHAGTIMLVDETADELRMAASYGLGQDYPERVHEAAKKAGVSLTYSPSGIVLRSGKPYIVPNVFEEPKGKPWLHLSKELGFSSIIFTPMKSGSKVIGLLNIYMAKPYQFKEEEINFAAIAASQAASVVHNARISKMLENKINELEESEQKLNQRACLSDLGAEVGFALNQGDTLQEILSRCAGSIARNLDAALARIWTINKGENILELRASAGMYTHTNGFQSRIPVGKSNIGLIARERIPKLINEVSGDPDIHEHEWTKREGITAFAGYPLIIEEELVGVMAIFARQPLTDFTVSTLASVADNIALCIERKLSEEKLRESEEKYRVLFDAAPMGIGIADIGGNILDGNLGMQEMTGFTLEELKSIGVGSIYADPNERKFLLKSLEETGRMRDWEIRLKRKDETTYYALLNVDLLELDGYKVLLTTARDITERKRAEREKDRFLKAFASSTDGITIADENDRFIYVNEAYVKIFSYCQEDLIGNTWRKITPPEMIAPTEKSLSSTMHNKDIGIFYGEVPGLRKDGMIIPTEVRGKGLWDENGNYQGHICVVRDITERKHVEEALQKSNRQQNAILNNIPDIAWLKDKESRFIAVNEPFAKACGVSAEELVGKTDLDIWPQQLAEIYRVDDGEVMATGKRKQVEEPLVNTKGERRWIETIKTPIYNNSCEVIGTTGIARDITERKRMEEVLMLFSEAVENAPDGVQIADLSGHIIYSNKATEEIYGFSQEVFRGKHVDEMNADPGLASKVILPAIKESGRWVGELTVKHKDGKTCPVWLNASMIKNSKGEPIAMMGIIRDITERKRAEELHLENMRLEYASKAKSEFLANMSHELRTPLNAIIGFSELMTRGIGGKLNEKQESYAVDIFNAGKHLLRLINDILDLSKVEAGKIELIIEDFSVPEAINETLVLIKEQAAKNNVLIKKELDPQLEFIEADKQRLKQVLFNLLSNAVKFNRKGGTLTITTNKEGDMARISVSDTGIGIREEDIGKLFEDFVQLDSGFNRKYGGTGLGLAITKKLVELHEGKIMAKSKYGEGSTFTFLLPLKGKGGKTEC
ncbi:Methyl sulfide methyltransferase-associated sensor [uncultured archaeon]|nr:Methyl sulfide methyltransferase-associated sensor [uncultured archaeon]